MSTVGTKNAASRKHARKKVKTGCGTCKVRKVKCDEGQPACGRCVSTGRVCDGYGIWGGGGNNYGDRYPRKTDTVITDPLALYASSSDEERAHLDWFVSRASRKLPGVFGSLFWETLVMPGSMSEPAVRHAALALACAHRAYQSSVRTNSSGCPASRQQFVLQHYSKAITSLYPHFAANTRASIRVTLVTCVLFICLDLACGHQTSGLEHLRYGIRLLHQLNSTKLPSTRRLALPTPFLRAHAIENSLAEMLRRFCFQAALLGQPNISDVGLSLLPLPEAFKNTNEAQAHLVMLLQLVLQLTQMAGAATALDPALYSRLVRIKRCVKTQLDSWSITYCTLRSHRELSSIDLFAHHILCSHHILATVQAGACLNSNDEMIYDSFTDGFRSIISHSATIFRLFVSRELEGTAFQYHKDHAQLTSDMGWLPPLYYTALKCRDSSIRHNAIRLLRSMPSREGFWDASMVAAVATFIVGIEETNLALASDCVNRAAESTHGSSTTRRTTPVHEGERLSEVHIILADCTRDTVRLNFSRRTETGDLVACADSVPWRPGTGNATFDLSSIDLEYDAR